MLVNRCKKCNATEYQRFLYPCYGCKQPICDRCKDGFIRPIICGECCPKYHLYKDDDVTFLKQFYFSTVLKQYILEDIVGIIVKYC